MSQFVLLVKSFAPCKARLHELSYLRLRQDKFHVLVAELIFFDLSSAAVGFCVRDISLIQFIDVRVLGWEPLLEFV